ncbi:MAG: hypothetical protein HKN91_07715 [Acidimicrobiia bacterium]|nr:hypothetical protein [Acidimicrobiia bacterium]
MKLSRAIPAGLVDAGLASLATFVLNIYAIAVWERDNPEVLGMYFLYMTAFLLASAVPNQLLFIPAEKMTLDVSKPARVRFFGKIARLGIPAGVAAALLLLLATAVGATKPEIGFVEDQLPFLVTAGIATVFSPLQNHARRLLHLAGKSWAAATVSLVQAATAGTALIVLVTSDVAAQWIPIGSLAIANVVSVTTAAVLARRTSDDLSESDINAVAAVQEAITYRTLTPTGRWLVATGVISLGNNFVVESAVASLAGLEALALAGAAKTVAQPILVLANGLRSVLGPPSMEAARDHDRAAARKVASTFFKLTLAAVAAYTLIAGFDWVGNPLAALIDGAYAVPFLVALSILANGFNGAAFPGRLELIGAGKERQLFGADLRANVGQLAIAVAIAAAAGANAEAGSFARPVAFAALGVGRIFYYRRGLDVHYNSPADDETRTGTIPQSPDTIPPPV